MSGWLRASGGSPRFGADDLRLPLATDAVLAVDAVPAFAGLVLRLDSTAGVSLSGSTVLAVQDLAENNHDARPGVSPTLVAAVFGSDPAIRFDGTQYLDVAGEVDGKDPVAGGELGFVTPGGITMFARVRSTYAGTASDSPAETPPNPLLGNFAGWSYCNFGLFGGQVIYHWYDDGVTNVWTSFASAGAGGALVNDGSPHTIAVTHTPAGVVTLYVDGVQVAQRTGAGFSALYWGITSLGRGYNNPTNRFRGDVRHALVYDRALSTTQISDLHTWATPATNRTIAADVGSFALTGVAANLLDNKRVVADLGTFALSGIAANTLLGRRLVADVATFAFTGIAANTLDNKLVTADVGAFALTGPAAGTLVARRVVADVSGFALAGIDAGTLLGRRVVADVAAVSLTGVDATLTKSALATLTADAGAFALTGLDAGTAAARRIVADLGALALTGVAANTLLGRRVVADVSAFTLSGVAANTLQGRRVAADAAAFALTGVDANLARSRLLAADVATFALTGVSAALFKVGASAIAADPGTFVVTATDAGVTVSRRMTADPTSFAAAGIAAALTVGRRITSDAGAFAYGGTDAAVLAGRTISSSTSIFSLGGFGATPIVGRRLSSVGAIFALAGNDAALVYTPLNFYTLVAGSRSFAITGNDAVLDVPSSRLFALELVVASSRSLVVGARASSGVEASTASLVGIARHVLRTESADFVARSR